MIKLEQSQKQKQQLVMTHEMKQAIQLLHFNVFELSSFIENEADLNIFIEYENPIKKDITGSMEREESIITKSEEDDGNSYVFTSNSGFNESIAKDLSGQTLKENLLFQVGLLDINKDDKFYLEYLINDVDSKGYLNIDTKAVSSVLSLKEESIIRYINILQSFSPCGVCAKSPIERIEIQLKEKGIYKEEHSILLNIYMENIAYGKINSIHLKTGFDIDYINDLIEDIKSCNLNIASEFIEDEDNLYIYPELRVVEKNGKIIVSLIEDNTPSIQMDKSSLIEMSRFANDKDLSSFYKEHYDKGLFIISAVKKRKENMLKVTEEIFKVQGEFLKNGNLKPLKMSDIANECDINVSTVSRIVNEKYVETKRGVFPLKSFFKQTVGGNSELNANECTDDEIKNQIKVIIENEDKKKPFSDEKISKMLKEKGCAISRRTVNKYRGQMGIPSTTIRRKD